MHNLQGSFPALNRCFLNDMHSKRDLILNKWFVIVCKLKERSLPVLVRSGCRIANSHFKARIPVLWGILEYLHSLRGHLA